MKSKNDYFQIFIIDKKLNTYSDNKIKFPIIDSINKKNETEIGDCMEIN